MVVAKGSEPAQKNQTSMELKGDREIIIARTFNAPPRIVFDAWTNPDLVKRWWAPRSLDVTIVSCDADVRVGGTYRYVLRPAKQPEFAFSGRYNEVTPHSRLVYTMTFEPMAANGEAVITVTFEEHEGKTRLVATEIYPSREVRDGTISSGMEKGMRETMDQLDELVASLS
jgi:uncharacterized protein YndB with AHSA1/START domain